MFGNREEANMRRVSSVDIDLAELIASANCGSLPDEFWIGDRKLKAPDWVSRVSVDTVVHWLVRRASKLD